MTYNKELILSKQYLLDLQINNSLDKLEQLEKYYKYFLLEINKKVNKKSQSLVNCRDSKIFFVECYALKLFVQLIIFNSIFHLDSLKMYIN